MFLKGYLKRGINRLIIGAGLLVVIFSGCSILNTPQTFQYSADAVSIPTNGDFQNGWDLDSLLPAEGSVLEKRRKVTVSCYLEAYGKGEYLLQLSTDRKIFKPLPFILNDGGGSIRFSARIWWLVKPKGKTEIVVVSLYKIERSSSGRTEYRTLLKEIRRNYDLKPPSK